jgi:hypothetical protein
MVELTRPNSPYHSVQPDPADVVRRRAGSSFSGVVRAQNLSTGADLNVLRWLFSATPKASGHRRARYNRRFISS